MRININVVRKFAYITRPDICPDRWPLPTYYPVVANKAPLIPPMIKVHQVEIVATPASQPGKATVIPPAIQIHQVDMAPRRIGMPRALHIRKEAISRSLETRIAREASRRRPHVYQSSLRDHRMPEVDRG